MVERRHLQVPWGYACPVSRSTWLWRRPCVWQQFKLSCSAHTNVDKSDWLRRALEARGWVRPKSRSTGRRNSGFPSPAISFFLRRRGWIRFKRLQIVSCLCRRYFISVGAYLFALSITSLAMVSARSYAEVGTLAVEPHVAVQNTSFKLRAW